MKPQMYKNLNIDSLLHQFDLWNIHHCDSEDLYSRYRFMNTAVQLNMDFESYVSRVNKFSEVTLKSLLLK